MNYVKKTKKILEDKIILEYNDHITSKEGYSKEDWTQNTGRTRSKIILRYLIEEKAKIAINNVPKVITKDFFYTHNIESMYDAFETSIYLVVDNAYPGLFQEWDFKDYWKTQKGLKETKKIVKEIIEKKMAINIDDIPKNYIEIIKKPEIIDFIEIFDNSFFKLIDAIYPATFTPWDFHEYKLNNTEENLKKAKESIIWLIEEKLKITTDEIPKKLSQKVFVEYRLEDMLTKIFHGSVYKAAECAYPEKFKNWHFEDEHAWEGKQGKIIAKKVLKHLVNEHLRILKDEIPKKLTHKVFTKYHLGGLLHQFHGSIYRAVDNAYPNEFQEWHFSSRVWNQEPLDDKAKDAIRWLVDKKLMIDVKEAPRILTEDLLQKHNLLPLLEKYDNSISKLLITAYPDFFFEWEFDQTTLWSDSDAYRVAKRAVIWLIEKKLKIPLKEAPNILTQDIIISHNLGGMLIDLFDGSLYSTLDNAYPGAYKRVQFSSQKEEHDLALAKKITRWLIESTLKIPLKDVVHVVNGKLFHKHGLSGMLKKYFRNSIYLAIQNAYPGQIEL